MDADTWGWFETLTDVAFVFGEACSLQVELLCTHRSVLGRIQNSRHLGAVNALADALNLPRSVVHNLHVERIAGDRDPKAVLESDSGGMPMEVGGDDGRIPANARPRQVFSVEADRGRRQVVVPDGARQGSVFVAPRLINGARVDVDVVAVEVPAGYQGGDIVNVRAVGGSVTAVVPDGARQGEIFMQEYHPERTGSPGFRVSFEIDQPRYTVDGWEMGEGKRQYPLHLMETEMKYRLNARGCDLVTHMSIEKAGAAGGGRGADADGASFRLWGAAERGDLGEIRQELAQLEAAGLIGRGKAGAAGPVNKAGPCSGATALHLAARWGHVEVLQELLLHGQADAEMTDIRGRTAEEVAWEYGRQRAAHALESWRLDSRPQSKGSMPSAVEFDEHHHSEQPIRGLSELEMFGPPPTQHEYETTRAKEQLTWKERNVSTHAYPPQLDFPGMFLRDCLWLQVDAAVALIRAVQRDAPPQALLFDDSACTRPILEPWPGLDRCDPRDIQY